MTGLKNPGKAISILLRGSSKLVVEELERFVLGLLKFNNFGYELLKYRSLHDALCVVRCLIKKRAILPGMMYLLRKLSEN